MEQNLGSLRLAPIAVAISAGLLLFFSLVTVAASPANTPTRPAEQLPLTGCQNGCDLNRADDGSLYVSDYDAGEIWRIQPATDVYTLYQVAGSPADAQPDPFGNIWWVDGGETFSRLSMATGLETTWTLSNFESFSGLAFDQAGYPWIVESFGFNSKIHRFDPGSNELCGYHFGGAYSDYLLYSQGAFWTLNWFQDQIVRFDPVTLAVKSWAMTSPTGDPQGLAMDQDGHLWWTNRRGSLYRLEPGNDRQTRFELPVGAGSRVEMVEARDHRLWYTESVSGTVGALDPAVATGFSNTLTTTQKVATESCITISPEDDIASAVESGTFSWTDISLNTNQEQAGWEIYQLPESASPFGLASGAGYQWATDLGRGQLLRFRPIQAEHLMFEIKVEPAAVPHGTIVNLSYTASYSAPDLAPAKDVVVKDELCPNIIGPASGGDANQNGFLDVDEQWLYFCQFTIPDHEEGEDDPLVGTGVLEGKYMNGLSLDPVDVHYEIDILHQSDYEHLFLPFIVKG